METRTAVARGSLMVVVVLLATELGVQGTDKRSPDFGYDGEGGPQHWAEKFHSCAGKHQSPIDIEEHLVRQVRLPALHFKGFNDEPDGATLTNNGHTVQLKLKNPHLSVSGGPLNGEYVFSQLHFHWGANDSMGSEDTVNNHTFPMELHMVFFKKDYKTADEAMDHDDGLAVFAVFYEVFGDDNEDYEDIVKQLPRVTMPESSIKLQKPIIIDSLLPYTRHLYFTYNGSLTTPPCSEVVTWLDFKQPVLLSHRQLEAFRELHTASGRMTHNFRPTQPISGRVIMFNVAEAPSSAPCMAPLSIISVISSVLFLLTSVHHWR